MRGAYSRVAARNAHARRYEGEIIDEDQGEVPTLCRGLGDVSRCIKRTALGYCTEARA